MYLLPNNNQNVLHIPCNQHGGFEITQSHPQKKAPQHKEST